jgi:Glyoxalase-like domain
VSRAYAPVVAFTFQVTVDCAEPHGLADWWAETLGWQVEPQDEAFIRRMVAEGHADESEAVLHRGALVWRTGAAIVAPEGAAPSTPRVLFQWVPEPKSVKNRVHLDIRTGDADVEAIRERLVRRGATVLHEGRQGPHTWVTMADPEGNEFCI